MISSQLGTEARPRVFLTGLRDGRLVAAGVVGVGVRRSSARSSAVERRRRRRPRRRLDLGRGSGGVEVGLDRRLGAEGGGLARRRSSGDLGLGVLADQLDGVLAERQLVGRYGGQPAPAGVGQVVAGGLGLLPRAASGTSPSSQWASSSSATT